MKHRINVLYVLNSPGGGATQGIIELLRGVPRDRFEPYVVFPGQPNAQQLKIFQELTTATQAVVIGWWNRKHHMRWWQRAAYASSMSLRTVFGLRTLLHLIRLIKRWNIDLVHTSTSLTIAGAIAAKLCRKPHVWHIREWIGAKGLFRFWLPDAMLIRVFNGLADQIVPMSRFAGSIFFEREAAQKIKVVNDGVDCKRFLDASRGEAVRKKLGIQSEELVVGMVANLSSVIKRHEIFIRMAAQLASRYPRVRFVIFGKEPNDKSKVHNKGWLYAQTLKRLANELGLSKTLIWAGFCEDIPGMMHALDILVHPCEQEGFGRIAIEGMAAGKPVVGPNQGGIAESVVNGKSGYLVHPNDVCAFARATGRLISDPHLRKTMGQYGRSHVKKHFSLQKHVEEMCGIYLGLLQKGQNFQPIPHTRTTRSSLYSPVDTT